MTMLNVTYNDNILMGIVRVSISFTYFYLSHFHNRLQLNNRHSVSRWRSDEHRDGCYKFRNSPT